jgi:site-specific DNA-methyltransferase (adenine-specific)
MPIYHKKKKTGVYEGDTWKIETGDCCDIMANWENTERANFIFADPPYNIGQSYSGYNDRVSDEDYRRFTSTWMDRVKVLLAPTGILAVHTPDGLVPEILRESKGLYRIGWVIWHYRFGQCVQSKWINSHAHCLIFAKNYNKYTWHPPLVESDRATTYSDARTQDSATPGKRVPLDVWGVPSDGPYWGRVQGNSKERRKGHPNQLPEVYLHRLLATYTNEGDLVIDPFVGSGTTPTVAVGMGRKFLGCEISPTNAESAAQRVEEGPIRI